MSPELRALAESAVIRSGSHPTPEDGMCIMEAVAWVAGEPHSDAPQCACPSIRRFAIRINDRIDDDALRTQLFRPLVTRLVGSASTGQVRWFRNRLIADWVIRYSLPIWWQEVPSLREYAAVLRALPPLVTKASLREARDIIRGQRQEIWGRVYSSTRAAAADAADAAADAADAAADA